MGPEAVLWVRGWRRGSEDHPDEWRGLDQEGALKEYGDTYEYKWVSHSHPWNMVFETHTPAGHAQL